MSEPRTTRARCRSCGDVIESVRRHDWVQCACGAIFVDGGFAYDRRGDTGDNHEVLEGRTIEEVRGDA